MTHPVAYVLFLMPMALSISMPAMAADKNVDALKGHALVIHTGADNYADTPAPLGGGGGHFACGVVG